ncbi:MAG: hypothetical protein K6A90_06335 [Lachnospiraceae bacterium]|nr:hypothetical protein [Lachnospiraceae bacterium]
MQSSINKLDFIKENLEPILLVNSENCIDGQIVVPVGRNTDGYIYENFADIPNLLFSGTTGSGKTSFVLTLILEMMSKYTPNDICFLICMVWSSQIQRTVYRWEPGIWNGLPYLLQNNR